MSKRHSMALKDEPHFAADDWVQAQAALLREVKPEWLDWQRHVQGALLARGRQVAERPVQ
jgi:hypothetical protein